MWNEPSNILSAVKGVSISAKEVRNYQKVYFLIVSSLIIIIILFLISANIVLDPVVWIQQIADRGIMV